MRKHNLLILGILALLLGPSAAAGTGDLAAWWSFDQIKDRQAMDVSGKIADPIGGNFKPAAGVVGAALKLDGFTTEIVRPAATAPQPGGGFTLEAWLALAAYPWNWCPIVGQSRGQEAGYRFAVGPRGQLSLQVAVGGQWVACTSPDFALPLRQWVHVAAVFEPGKGTRIYVNGRESGNVAAAGELAVASDADLRIGVIPEPMKPSNIHREYGTLVGWFSLDGILDELKFYQRARGPEEIQAAFAAVVPATAPELPLRRMPAGPPGPGRFGAYYTQLKYYDEWDALWRVGPESDVLVRFDDSSARVVFWRGTRYSPAWVSENGLWMADQSVEAWDETEGCFEHMQDPKCLYSHVRIIENTDARVVVHWRYAPVSAHNHLWNVDPKTGFACWVDEYYTIYPDATGVRNVTWQRDSLGNPRQFQESLPFTQPGQYSRDVVKTDFCTVANLKGESATLSFVEKPAAKANLPTDLTIQRYNFKAQNSPFIVFEPGNQMGHVADRNVLELARPGACSHWPVGLLPCDGRTSQAPDRATHFLGFPISQPPLHTSETREWWSGLYGMTPKPIEELVQLARSWAQAPEMVIKGNGFRCDGYDRNQRSYQIRRTDAEAGAPLEAEIRASETSPLVNLPLVVHGWGSADAALEINGKPVPRGKQFRFGHLHQLDESTLLVWIQLEATGSTTLRLSPITP